MTKRGTVLRFAPDPFLVLCTLFRFTWLQSNTVQYRQWEIVNVALRLGVWIYSVLYSQSRCDAKDVCMQQQLDDSFASKPENTSISGRPVVNSDGCFFSGTGSAKNSVGLARSHPCQELPVKILQMCSIGSTNPVSKWGVKPTGSEFSPVLIL